MDMFISLIILVNVFAFGVYGMDKYFAKTRMRRIPERTLFIMAFIGGGLGCLAGMYILRHKTKKVHFLLGIPLITIIEYTLMYFSLFN